MYANRPPFTVNTYTSSPGRSAGSFANAPAVPRQMLWAARTALSTSPGRPANSYQATSSAAPGTTTSPAGSKPDGVTRASTPMAGMISLDGSDPRAGFGGVHAPPGSVGTHAVARIRMMTTHQVSARLTIPRRLANANAKPDRDRDDTGCDHRRDKCDFRRRGGDASNALRNQAHSRLVGTRIVPTALPRLTRSSARQFGRIGSAWRLCADCPAARCHRTRPQTAPDSRS